MATLKIRELSVGDWVRYKRKECSIASIYMAAEGYPHEVALTYQGICCGCAYIDHLEPIPITAEMLEKNGFVKNGDYNEWSTGNWEDIPFIGISLSRQSMRIKNLGTDIFLENKVVYVHQLQRALSLANIDKEITL